MAAIVYDYDLINGLLNDVINSIISRKKSATFDEIAIYHRVHRVLCEAAEQCTKSAWKSILIEWRTVETKQRL